MPELIMERPKMSLQMHETLKRYILRERRKKKEEDVANEQKMREELKKAEIKTQTIESNKEQIKQLSIKLDDLQLKKRDLFNQLKKVLNEETNLKKTNRLSIGPPGSLMPGDQSNPFSILMYTSHPGHPQMLAPQHPPPSHHIPPGQGLPNLPIVPQTPNNQSTASLNKPQSPFHPPHHLLPPHHMPPSNSTNFLKYLQNPSIPITQQILPNQSSLLIPPSSINPNLLNQTSMSPSSSPHLLTSSPRHHLPPATSTSIKRQRSPSPPNSPLSIPSSSLLHNQFLFNQNQLGMHQPSISPASIIPSSPPPQLINQSSFNSPSSANKKTRQTNNMNMNQSPQQRSQSNTQQSQQPSQQQSAFSTYLNNRPNSMSGFQSPSSQNKNTQNSPNVNIPAPQFNNSILQAQTTSANSFNMPRNISVLPPQPSHSSLPPLPVNLPQQFPHHYLNSLTQEQAKMILQQQQAQFGSMHQSHFPNISSLPMISAAAAAAVAAAAANAHQHSSQAGPNVSSNGSGAGGSITGGFSIRSNNQQPHQHQQY